MAFVVVAHLAPGRESALAEILGRSTSLPVREAVDGETAEAGHVYVIPPDALVSMQQGRLQVQKANPAKRERNPIDVFLGSLAEDDGERAIAIILSGAGSDGTLGIKAIKEHGGLTLAQGADGSRPRHPGMPDERHRHRPRRPRAAGRARSRPSSSTTPAGSPPSPTSPRAAVRPRRPSGARKTICAILRNQVGHDFTGYKEQDLPAPRAAPDAGPAARAPSTPTSRGCGRSRTRSSLLFRDLLIGVTDFFRDTEAFEALEKLGHAAAVRGQGGRRHDPGLGARAAPPARRSTRSPSCCASAWTRSGRVPKVQLFATDIDEHGAGRRPGRPLPRGAARRRVAPSDCAASSPRTAAATCSPRRCATCASSRRTA